MTRSARRAISMLCRSGLTAILAVSVFGLGVPGRTSAQVPSGPNHIAVTLDEAERAWLAEHPVIKVAPDPDFPPFEFFDESGAYRGIVADYLAILEKRLGVRFQVIRQKSWTEAVAKAKAREVDMFPAATNTPQRSEYMLFTSPNIRLPGVIITAAKQPTQNRVK